MIQNILFIPGLGDGTLTRLQNWYVSRWNNKNRQVHIFDPKWSSNEDYRDKYTRLLQTIDQIKPNGELVVIGVSAGGSLATRLLADIPNIKRAHIVSGKNSGSNIIGEAYAKRSPALIESVRESEKALKKADEYEDKVTVYRPLIDKIVPLNNMLVGKARSKRVPAIGHVAGITTTLVFYLP